MFTGLATIRRDGFVSLKVEKDSRAGWFTTIPLQATGTSLQLEINAQGLSEAAAVIRDGVAVPVLWPYGGQNLSLPSGESLQLRFQLEGKARLYSLTFK